MRISDWSSDGCSSDLNSGCLPPERAWLNGRICEDGGSDGTSACVGGWVDAYRALNPEGQDYTWWSNRGAARANNVGWRIDYQFVTPSLRDRLQGCSILRSEEHTSELQSLMRISYAVFCLKKKNTTK